MNVYDSLKSVKFNIIEGDRVTVEDFWDKDCSIFKKERIYLIKSGTAWMFLKGKKIFLEPNKLYFIPSYSVLYGKTLSQLEHYFIHFEFESDGVDIFSLFHLINEVPASQEDEYFLDKLLELMKMSSYSPQVQLQENGIMQILLSKFLTSLEFNDENALRINTTLNYINDNIGRTITLEEYMGSLEPSIFFPPFQASGWRIPFAIHFKQTNLLCHHAFIAPRKKHCRNSGACGLQ